MQTKILLFDFDGTIADTAVSAIKIYNKIALKNNYKLITSENIEHLRNKSAKENIKDSGIPFWKLPFIAREIKKEHKKEILNSKIFDGIKDQLHLLKEKGHQLHIISSNSKENIESFLSLNQIKLFETIHSVSNFFGKHLKIIKMIKINKWDKSCVVYIGDESRDIEAAKKANIKSIAVTWGYNSEKALLESNPDLVFRSSSDFQNL